MLEPADLPVLRERRPPVRLGVLGVFPKLLRVAGHRGLSFLLLLDRRRFRTDRRARVALAAADLDPVSDRARLSYRRAEEVFTELTKPLAHHGITDPGQLAEAPGWTLHDLRHSALTHAAENGANTGTLLAYSGHASVASLARYTRVSPDALTRWQARRDPHRRR